MSGSAIAELWRLPDKQVTNMDGSIGFMRQAAIRLSNWIGWYRVLPDYGKDIREIPAGSVALILDGIWIDSA